MQISFRLHGTPTRRSKARLHVNYRIVGIAVNVRWESSYAQSFRQSSAKLFVMAERLKDKIGIVTGAGSGIGRACAIALAKEGAREIGDRAFAISADVSQTAEISRLLDQTVNRFGGLNTLVNNAGVLHV